MALTFNGGKDNSKDKAPIVADVHPQYGLYVGPKGAFSKSGIQCKAPKWANLFTSDEDGTPNLMNVLAYLDSESNDFNAVLDGADAFVAAYAEFKAKRAA